jgi:mannose-6-phosphate isomerase-like protein (cupin superfamily)
MFVIFDNEAEFTIDGRTSRLQGPAGAPCRMGHSHAIYNPTDRPTEWMNIAVGSIKGKYDAFDLEDDRVDVQKDAKPVFITLRLDKQMLKRMENHYGGKGAVMYRRALQPEVFYTNWSYVDHVVVPSGASIGKHRSAGVEEFWYVINGDGTVHVNNETAPVKRGDAVPMHFGDVKSIESGSGDLELMIVGVARTKWALDVEAVK